MVQRTASSAVLVFAAILICARPAHAQQTLNFTLGYFAPLDENSRVSGDVLNANRTFLVFDLDDFGGASVGGEWLVPLGNFLEAGAGVSYTGQTVPSVYRDFVDSDGTEIDQDLRLRMVPIAFTVRVLPFGQSSPVQPYSWRRNRHHQLALQRVRRIHRLQRRSRDLHRHLRSDGYIDRAGRARRRALRGAAHQRGRRVPVSARPW